MVRDVVEVVVRFGDTILDVAQVGPADTYRIGTAAGTQLAVPGVTSFPLVDRRVVRCPLGMQANERDGVTELSIGALSICVSRSTVAVPPVVRPRFDGRPLAFVLGSLLVHLAIWFIAMTFAPLERVAAPRAPQPRLAHITAPPPPPEPKRTPRKQVSAGTTQPQHTSRVRRTGRSRGGVARGTTASGRREPSMDVGGAVARAIASFDDIHLPERMAELDPADTYNPEADDSPSFGKGRSFDPSQREEFGTVETGAFEMIPPDVKLCPEKSCTVTGPIPALYVRTHLHHHMDAIYACYVRYAEGPGTIVLEFTITADGAVRDARGSGLGETGACAARVASEIFFKALGSETHVRYPVRFKPYAGPFKP